MANKCHKGRGLSIFRLWGGRIVYSVLMPIIHPPSSRPTCFRRLHPIGLDLVGPHQHRTGNGSTTPWGGAARHPNPIGDKTTYTYGFHPPINCRAFIKLNWVIYCPFNPTMNCHPSLPFQRWEVYIPLFLRSTVMWCPPDKLGQVYIRFIEVLKLLSLRRGYV